MIFSVANITSELRTVVKRLNGRGLRNLLLVSWCWVLLGKSLLGQVAGDYGSASNGPNNWTNPLSWLVCTTNGTWFGATPAASAPGGLNNVWIHPGHAIVLEGGGKACNNLTVESTGIISGDQQLDINGNLVVNGTITTTNSIRLYGSSVNGSGIIATTTQFQIYNSNTAVQITPGNLTFSCNLNYMSNNLTITNSGIVYINGSINENSVTGCVWTNAANSSLNIGGNIAAAVTLNAFALGNTVNYYAPANQDIKIPSGNSYNNLTVTGAETKNLLGNITVTQDLYISGPTTLNCGQYQITGNTNGRLQLLFGCTLMLGNPLDPAAVSFPTNYNSLINIDPNTTVIYQSAGNQTISSLPATSAYGNLTTATSGNKTLGGNINVKGNMQIGSGTVLDVSASNFKITIERDWMNNNPAGGFDEGAGTVEFTGTSAQSISSTGGETFYGLMVNKAGEKVNLSARNVTVTNLLTLTLGKIDVSTNSLIISSTGSISGGSASSYVIAESSGTLKQYINGADKQFPVGTTGSFLPVSLNNSGSTADNYSVNLFTNVTTNGLSGGLPVSDIENTVKVTWRVNEDASGGTTSLVVTPQWNTNNEGSTFTRSNSSVNFHNGTSWTATSPSAPASGSNPWTRVGGNINNFLGSGSFGVFSVGCTADVTPPLLSCVANQVRGTSTGCTYVVVATEFNLISFSDNCTIDHSSYQLSGVTNIVETTATSLAGVAFNTGLTVVTWRVYDAAGNSSSCSFNVTVQENTPPVAICRNINIILDLVTGEKTIIPADIDGGSSDNCGPITFTLSKSSFTCTDIGPNNVTLTVTDAAGNPATCISTVTVGYALVPNQAVTPATDAICNGETTNLALTNVIPTTWTWSVTAPPQITGWSDDFTGTKSSIQQPLNNSGLIAYRAVYTILPRLYNTCDLAPVTANVWVEPTPQVTIVSSIPTLCSGNNVNVTINSPTNTTTPVNLSYVIAVTSDSPGNLGGTASTGSTVLKAALPLHITGTLTNSSLTPIVVTYTVLPKLDGCPDGPSQSVTVTVAPLLLVPVVVGCPANITVQTGTGQLTCNQTATWVEPTAMVNCSGTMTYTTRSHAPGATFPVGTTAVTYTFTDAALNTATCTFNVIVQDNTPPVITGCPLTITVQTGVGRLTCNQVAAWTEPTAFDNCSGALAFSTRSHAPGATFPVGTTPVTYTFTDAAMNTATCTFDVIVQDNTPPVITGCPSTITVQTGVGRLTCNQVATWTEPTALDNCSGALTYTIRSHAPGATFPVGTTPVTYTFTDIALNTATCTFNIIVQDNTPPVIIGCPTNVTIQTGVGQLTCNQVATWAEPTALDNCSDALNYTTRSHAPGATFPLGTTPVTYTFTDAALNTATCTFNVIVQDNTPPVISGCPSTITVQTGVGRLTCNQVSTWTEPTALDNCSGVLAYTARSHTPGATFPVGTTPVTYTFTDAALNTSTCTFNVIIQDNTPPIISGCPGNITHLNDPGLSTAVVTWPEPTATDNCTPAGNLFWTRSHTPGSTFPAGSTTVTYSVRDAANNVSNVCTFTVTVTDGEFPVITCPVSGQQNVTTNDACRYIHSGTTWNATATDNNAVTSLTYNLTGVTSGTGTNLNNVAFNLGVTMVTWTARDNANNAVTCNFTVSVTDDDNPVITCPVSGQQDVNTSNGCRYIHSGTSWNATATDNCSISSLTYTLTGLTTGTGTTLNNVAFNAGVTTVTWTATDAAGNSISCSYTVSVTDKEKPVINNCPVNITRANDAGNCSAVVTWTEPTATDNCTTNGNLVWTKSHIPGSVFPVGTTTVTYTVTDAANNVSEVCRFTVTVTDHELPISRCKNMNIILDLITGTRTITPADIDNGSYDNCGTIQLAIDKLSFTCSDIGSNTVTLTVTDEAGNQSTCTSAVTVNYDRPSNPAVSPATSAICNGETTNLLLTNVIPTSWTWTVTAPAQITGWVDDLSGSRTVIQQNLVNSDVIAHKVVYRIIPRLYKSCALTAITAEVDVEPTPQVTIASSTPIICNGSNIDLEINSPTVTTTPANLSYVIAVTSTNPGSLGGTASAGLTVHKTNLPLNITGTLTNSSDAPIEVTYIVTPKLNSCSDGPPKSVKVTVNPTPRVIPVNSNSKPDSSICYGGSTQIILTSPTVMTSGNILFDYTVSVSGGAGVVIGNTAPEVNRPLNYFISFPYQNTSAAMQSVYYSITPKVDNAICAQGNTVVSEIKVHPQTIQYNYPGTDASGVLITNPLTCETSTVKAALRVIISNGASPYQISWTGPNNYTNNYDSIEIKNLNQGQYTVRVTDNLGCFNESSKTIVNFTARPQIIPNIKFPNIHVSCPGGNDGSLRVSVLSGITQPYIYWVMYNDVNILFNGVFPTSIDKDPGAYWDYSGLRAGFYKIVIRDVNGCEVARTTELKEPAPIVVGFQKSNYNGFNVSCIGYSNGSVLATPSGGNSPYTYHWYPEFGVLTVSTNTNLLDSIPAGKYYLRTTDQLGCTKTDSVIITEPDGMQLTNSEVSHSQDGNTNISCNGGNDGFIRLTITGGSGTYFYNWTGPNGFTANSKDIAGLKAGVYSCTVKDNNDCLLISSLSFTLTEPSAIVIAGITSASNDGSYNINCYGGIGSIKITVSGGGIGTYLLTWSSTNGSGIVNGQEDQNSLTAGTYHLSVTDSNGCIALKDFTLTQPAALVTVLVPTNITCESTNFNNGSINLTVSGGIAPYTYTWSNGATTEDITGLSQGYYIVTVTDANGCFKTDSVRVNLPPPLTYTKKVSDYNGYGISCYGLANGSIEINLTSGLAPYIYTWTGPNGFKATTKDISGLQAGQYTILITDKNLCTATETFVITEPLKFGMTINLSESIAGGFNINCAGESTGSISIEPHNQVNTISYLWADGIFGKTRTNLRAGIYTVIIIDANNCHIDSVITLTEPHQMALVLDITMPFCPDKPDGEVKSKVTGGVMGTDFLYKWSDNSTGPNLLNIPAGFYSLKVNDLNGCSVKDSAKIEPLNETCLIIPNAISPNGDLINDVWNIGLIDLYPNIEIKIFNRWGELVWRSEKGYPRQWDGTSKGSPLPMDSYHYIIDLHNGSKPIIGNVTIMK